MVYRLCPHVRRKGRIFLSCCLICFLRFILVCFYLFILRDYLSSEVSFPWRFSNFFFFLRRRNELEKKRKCHKKPEDTVLFKGISFQWLVKGKPHKIWLLFSLRMESSHMTDTCSAVPNTSLTLSYAANNFSQIWL